MTRDNRAQHCISLKIVEYPATMTKGGEQSSADSVGCQDKQALKAKHALNERTKTADISRYTNHPIFIGTTVCEDSSAEKPPTLTRRRL